MLSVTNVRSAGGAASYYAKDNYYASTDADRSGLWVGKGAERLASRALLSRAPSRQSCAENCPVAVASAATERPTARART